MHGWTVRLRHPVASIGIESIMGSPGWADIGEYVNSAERERSKDIYTWQNAEVEDDE